MVFEQKFGIKTVVGRGSGSRQIDRILAERRGGRYNVDIVISGQRGILGTLYPAGALESIKDLMFRPEVVDKSLWRNGIHRWGDPQGRYVQFHSRLKQSSYSGNGRLYQRRVWESNFIPNAPDMGLYGDKARGTGINVQLKMVQNNLNTHISEFPVGTYRVSFRP